MAMKRTIDFHLNEQRKKDNLYRAMKNDLGNGSSTDEEPTYLSTDLYPLSHYVNDHEQLIHQLFSVVHGKRLSRLIPSELKHMSFEELKADCLIQLLSMSKKRILSTLEGKDMNSSSDSDDSIDNQKKQILEAEKKDDVARKRSHKEKKIKLSKKKKVETDSESEGEKSEGKDGKTLLEILELEMKAKAIRALLGPNLNDNNMQVEEAIKNEIIQEKTGEKNSVDKCSSEDKSWNERYEEREDVKEVVKTSKLCTSMRRRMLLHQQKMLADRAKLKAAEAEKIKSGDTIKSKLDEKLQNVYSKNDEEQFNANLQSYSNDIFEKLSSHHKTVENTDNLTQEIKQVNKNVCENNVEKTIDSDEHKISSNTQESTDDDSQKSTDFERVLNEYTQKNTDLEKTINEYSKKNTDLKEEINKCSLRNDDMEYAMNRCAQKNSDIESAINNFSATNDSVNETISKDNENNSAFDTSTGESSKTKTNFDLVNSQNSKKNIDLKAIVKEYSKRNTDIIALMKEYSQNNVNIQSVIGDYSDGNLKLETIIDEYSLRNSKIKTMIDEYSFNNTNVEKIIDRSNRKQFLIDKYELESAAGKSNHENSLKEKLDVADTVICDLKNSSNLETEMNSSVVKKSVDEEDKSNSAVN